MSLTKMSALSLFVFIPTLASASETVRWKGSISDSAQSHTTAHFHSLTFTRKDNGERYDIVDSPKLQKMHCENEGNYQLEIVAERTPSFLFWGNNLVVKDFKVVADAAVSRVPHRPAPSMPQLRSGYMR